MCTFLKYASFLGLIEFGWILCRIETVKIITPWYLLRFHRSLDQIESLRFSFFSSVVYSNQSLSFFFALRKQIQIDRTSSPHRTTCSEILENGFVGRQWVDRHIKDHGGKDDTYRILHLGLQYESECIAHLGRDETGWIREAVSCRERCLHLSKHCWRRTAWSNLKERMILDWASKYCLSSSKIWPNSFKCEMIKPPINQYA